MEKNGYVYIMASGRNGTLYVGVTSDLVKRAWQHKNAETDGFTKRYGVKQLVYFECHDTMESAITYEKKLKNRGRAKKIELIERMNPRWDDLFGQIA